MTGLTWNCSASSSAPGGDGHVLNQFFNHSQNHLHRRQHWLSLPGQTMKSRKPRVKALHGGGLWRIKVLCANNGESYGIMLTKHKRSPIPCLPSNWTKCNRRNRPWWCYQVKLCRSIDRTLTVTAGSGSVESISYRNAIRRNPTRDGREKNQRWCSGYFLWELLPWMHEIE